jgi:hypothetical protein
LGDLIVDERIILKWIREMEYESMDWIQEVQDMV